MFVNIKYIQKKTDKKPPFSIFSLNGFLKHCVFNFDPRKTFLQSLHLNGIITHRLKLLEINNKKLKIHAHCHRVFCR